MNVYISFPLPQGDVSETISTFFEKSKLCFPLKKSTLTLQEVTQFFCKFFVECIGQELVTFSVFAWNEETVQYL